MKLLIYKLREREKSLIDALQFVELMGVESKEECLEGLEMETTNLDRILPHVTDEIDEILDYKNRLKNVKDVIQECFA